MTQKSFDQITQELYEALAVARGAREGILLRHKKIQAGGGYTAIATELPGCIGEGATPDAAIDDLRFAMLEWHIRGVDVGTFSPNAHDDLG